MKITVCVGNCCHTKGSRQVAEELQRLIAQNQCTAKIDLRGIFCMKDCQDQVAVQVEDRVYSVSPETAGRFFQETVLAGM